MFTGCSGLGAINFLCILVCLSRWIRYRTHSQCLDIVFITLWVECFETRSNTPTKGVLRKTSLDDVGYHMNF